MIIKALQENNKLFSFSISRISIANNSVIIEEIINLIRINHSLKQLRINNINHEYENSMIEALQYNCTLEYVNFIDDIHFSEEEIQLRRRCLTTKPAKKN